MIRFESKFHLGKRKARRIDQTFTSGKVGPRAGKSVESGYGRHREVKRTWGKRLRNILLNVRRKGVQTTYREGGGSAP